MSTIWLSSAAFCSSTGGAGHKQRNASCWSNVSWVISQHRKTGLVFVLQWHYVYFKQRCLGRFGAAGIFSQHKMPAWFQIHAGICCEPEGLAPDGGLFYLTNKESTLDPRAARSVAERRPWGRKRRKHEALRRAFPERHTYLYAPARRSRTERGAGL